MAVSAVARALGGLAGVGHAIRSDIDLAVAAAAGFTPDAVDVIGEAMALTPEEFERLLLSRRTLRHRRAHQQTLTTDESDRAARLARVWVTAADTFGDLHKAQAWFRRPNRALKGRAPIDLLETGSGALVVEQVLTRIAHGVFE